MGICVADLSCPAHEIFQILPADFGGQVFDDHPVLGPGGSSVLLDPLAPPPVAAPAVAAAGPAGVLHRHPRPVQVATVEVAHRVVRIAVVVKLDKTVSLFEQNVEPSFVSFKEVFNVA